MDNMLKFDAPRELSSIIKVVGVGGGGCNALTHMYEQGIQGVDFIICNTDAQALESSPVPIKVQLGQSGLGAGSIPSVGKQSAIEKIDAIKEILEKNTKMVFITAGMGGGTGTGAAPVIAQAAREMGILTVAIVTLPFDFEGRKRKMQADAGIAELRKSVDSLLIICNDKLREVYGDLRLTDAFKRADDILTVAAKGIAELITVVGHINVDFEDVKTVMEDSGTALMSSAIAEGEDRAVKAIEQAISSPLLNDNDIKGAQDILLYIGSGSEEITMDEVSEITRFIQQKAGSDANIIWGNGIDESLGSKISITLIATGFDSEKGRSEFQPASIKKYNLQEEKQKEILTTVSAITEPISEITLITPEERQKMRPETKVNSETSLQEPQKESKPVVVATLGEDELFNAESVSQPEGTAEPHPEMQSDLRRTTWGFLSDDAERAEIERKSQERVRKLKDLSIKLKSPKDIEELESVPAYIRRNIELREVRHSSESEVSRFTLGHDDENRPQLKQNNSFLHDNVD